MISSLMEICRNCLLHKSSLKHLATPEERKPNENLLKQYLQILAENNSLSIAMETRKVDAWTLNDDYILLLLNAIKASKFYIDYMKEPVSSLRKTDSLLLIYFLK
jgi:N utilization substance protein B